MVAKQDRRARHFRKSELARVSDVDLLARGSRESARPRGCFSVYSTANASIGRYVAMPPGAHTLKWRTPRGRAGNRYFT